jgi:hypothetical protein
MMEEWNTGIMSTEKKENVLTSFHFSNIPLFQIFYYSIISTFQYSYLERRFYGAVREGWRVSD